MMMKLFTGRNRNQNKKEEVSAKAKFSYQIKQKRLIFEALAAMIKAGIDIVDAIDSLRRDRRSKYEQLLLNQMAENLHDGTPIWKVFQKYEMVPIQLLSLVRIGEESGTLPQNIESVQQQMIKNKQFTGRLRSASIYPAFVLLLLLAVTVVVIVFVLPRLSGVYTSLGSELPWYSQIMIDLGNFMSQYGSIVIPWFLITTVLTFYFVFINKKTKHIGQSLMFNTPIIHKIIVELQVSRMGQMLHNLTKGGISIEVALHLLSESTENHIYAKFYNQLREQIQEGNSFATAFQIIPRTNKLLPLIAQQIVISGEQTASLVDAFKRLGEEFEHRTEITAKDFSTIFEPALIIIVWLGVALVALAVIVPLYSVIGSFDNLTNRGDELSVTAPEENEPTDIIDFDKERFPEADSINEILEKESNNPTNEQQ